MSWDDNWTRALVTVAAAAVGAVLAGLVNAYAANRRIAEIKLQYEFKLRDGYLDNARQFIAPVYVPISIELTSFFKNYERYLAFLGGINPAAVINSDKRFKDDCARFVQAIDNLLERGADAYLTTALDGQLNEFVNFVRNSIHETSIRKRRVLQTNYDYYGLSTSPEFVIEHRSDSKINRTSIPHMTLRIPGFGVRLSYSEKVLAAPTESREFEARIKAEVPAMKFLIKEVTLGSNPLKR